MEFDIFVNTTRKLARSSLTGVGVPNVAPVYQTHLRLNIYFFTEGSTAALLDGSPAFVVAVKDANNPEASVLLQLTAPTTTETDHYAFEWDYIDSIPLAALLGQNAAIPANLEIVWTIDGIVERVRLPVSIANAWARRSDSAPDFTPFQASITAAGYLRMVRPSDNAVFHIGLNTGEPPT